MRNLTLKSTVSVAALLAAANVHATPPTVTMGLSDPNTYDQTGFTANLTGTGQILNTSDLIGMYGFNITTQSGFSPILQTPLYTVCLSPSGVLANDSTQYGYTAVANTDPTASKDSFPSSQWAASGILNAQFLFNKLSGQITTGASITIDAMTETGGGSAEGAAMALAMYTALYNSTAPGVAGTSGPFTIGGLMGATLNDYNDDLTLLGDNKSAIQTSPPGGSVLIPDVVYNSGGSQGESGPDGQEMILMTSLTPQGNPVPEPSTVIAGLLLLLPFGAGVFRVVRKKNA